MMDNGVSPEFGKFFDALLGKDAERAPAPQKQVHYDANDYIVRGAPSTVCYIPNFIDAGTERFLLEKVYKFEESQWDEDDDQLGWTGEFSATVAKEKFSDWFKLFVDPVAQIKNLYPANFQPGTITFHKYNAGAGIITHRDIVRNRPMHWILSLGSSTVLDLYQPPPGSALIGNGQEVFIGSILLEPRSLVMLKDDVNDGLMHGIKQGAYDVIHEKVFNSPEGMRVGTELPRGQRVSITNAIHFNG